MAFVEHKECRVCQQVTRHCNGKCSDCESRKRREELNKWQSMSYDERLDDLRKRVESLEAGPLRF